MTFYVENESMIELPFSYEAVAKQVAEYILVSEKCPFPTQINLLLTDNEGIRKVNKDYRDIDKETDVLSFPNIDYECPSDFSSLEEGEADYFDPETKELIFGDIIISLERVKSQALDYGHSEKREFAFLVAHSMYHLCGYDHMVDDEARIMEGKQESALQALGITREEV